MGIKARPLDERFHENYIPVTETGCWLWEKAGNGRYGDFQLSKINGKRLRMSAHRFSYELHYGPIPKGMSVLHKCDVTMCVNPDHLTLGTQDDNMKDMVKKGRHWSQTWRKQ